MVNIMTRALFSVYGSGFIESFVKTMRNVLNATADVLNVGFVSTIFDTLAGLSAALIIIYFFIHMVDRTTSEMMNTQKLAIMFAEMIACICVCIMAPKICSFLVTCGRGLLDMVDELFTGDDGLVSSSAIIEFVPDDREEFAELLGDYYPSGNGGAIKNVLSSVRFFIQHPIWSIESVIVLLITGILKLVGYFFAISAAVMFIVRMFFAPLGVVNLYRGEMSSGVRYFKSLLASACTFAAMLAMVGAASVLGSQLVASRVYDKIGLSDEGYNAGYDTSGDYLLIIDLSGNGDNTRYNYDDNRSITIVATGNKYTAVSDGAYSYYYVDETNNPIYDDSGNYIRDYTGVQAYDREKYPDAYESFSDEDTGETAEESEYDYAANDEEYFSDELERELSAAMDFRAIFIALIPQIVAIGGMSSASGIINEVIGVGPPGSLEG